MDITSFLHSSRGSRLKDREPSFPSLSQEGRQAFLIPGWAYGFSSGMASVLAEHRSGHLLRRQKGPQCAAGAVGLDRGQWLDLERGRGASQSPETGAEFGGFSRGRPPALLPPSNPRRWGVAVGSRGAEGQELWFGVV